MPSHREAHTSSDSDVGHAHSDFDLATVFLIDLATFAEFLLYHYAGKLKQDEHGLLGCLLPRSFVNGPGTEASVTANNMKTPALILVCHNDLDIGCFRVNEAKIGYYCVSHSGRVQQRTKW